LKFAAAFKIISSHLSMKMASRCALVFGDSMFTITTRDSPTPIWRCGQLDGAAAAGDLRMAIGRGGRGWRRRRGEGLGAMAEGMSVRDYFGAAENDEGVSLG